MLVKGLERSRGGGVSLDGRGISMHQGPCLSAQPTLHIRQGGSPVARPGSQRCRIERGCSLFVPLSKFAIHVSEWTMFSRSLEHGRAHGRLREPGGK